jgi:hypothetical protein
MKVRNPWIDPCIVRLEPAEAKDYLVRRGWKSLDPASNPILQMFEGPGGGEDTEAVLVPLKVDQGPMLQRMIDLVSELARFEDRWAIDVLSEMLQPLGGAPVNGPAVEKPARPTPREEISVVRSLVDQSDRRRAPTSPQPIGLSVTPSFNREESR